MSVDSGAVVADHAENLARHQVEIGMIEGGDAAVALHEPARHQDRLLFARGAHAATLRIHWSSATATMISRPTANSCQRLSRP